MAASRRISPPPPDRARASAFSDSARRMYGHPHCPAEGCCLKYFQTSVRGGDGGIWCYVWHNGYYAGVVFYPPKGGNWVALLQPLFKAAHEQQSMSVVWEF